MLTNSTVVTNQVDVTIYDISSGTVSGYHTYASAGVYGVSLTITSASGSYVTQTFEYVSVYDVTPQGIFSAGQNYQSPAGALASNPALSGRATFGLSYKYQGQVPTGHRQFSLSYDAGSFDFNATSTSFLVIANDVAVVSGAGQVNGQGDYRFTVVGRDNGGIRIQIVDLADNAVVYDTQPGAAITATPTTNVAGHVVVH